MTSSEDHSDNPLQDVLSRQLAVMRELQELMQAKQRKLVANEVEGLSEMSRREEELALRLARLEQQRIDLLAQRLGLAGDEAGAVPASRLGSLLGTPDSGMEGIAGEMRGQILELQQLQDDNRVLTARLVEYGDMVLKLVTQGDDQPGYTSHGRPAEGSRRELLNCRI